MADDVDIAQGVNEFHQERSLAEVRAKVAPETHPDFDGKHCVECEDDIPPARLALGKVRCVQCQTDKEKHDKMFVKFHEKGLGNRPDLATDSWVDYVRQDPLRDFKPEESDE